MENELLEELAKVKDEMESNKTKNMLYLTFGTLAIAWGIFGIYSVLWNDFK